MKGGGGNMEWNVDNDFFAAEAANKRTCMDLLSDLAQLCATFTTVKKATSGYDGCLAIEPALLGSTQAVYHIGCFNFNEGSIRQLDTTV